MTWADLHGESEALADQAHEALRSGNRERARSLFAAAAKCETLALDEVSPEKARTYGITAVSAVALWYKAGRFIEAEALACRALAVRILPEFAANQLGELLQSIVRESTQGVAAHRAPLRR